MGCHITLGARSHVTKSLKHASAAASAYDASKSMKPKNHCWPFLIFCFYVFILSGCEKETPAERTGEMIEDATEDVGGAVEEAGEKIEDATDH